MVDSVIQFNWTRTNWVKTTAQLISTPMVGRGAQNWWVIYANGKSDIIRCKAKLVERSIIQRQPTLDLERILLVSSSPLLDVLYCHCRVQTRQKVFKTWVINRRDSRTVRHKLQLYNAYEYTFKWLGVATPWNSAANSEGWMVYKSLNWLASDYMSSKFILCSDFFNSYNLRDSENKLAFLLSRTCCYRNSFCYSGAVLWNNLPTNVRKAKSLTLNFYLEHGIHGKQALIW